MVPGRKQDELTAILAMIRSQAVKADRAVAAIEYVGSAVELLRWIEKGKPNPLSEELFAASFASVLSEARDEVLVWLRDRLDLRSLLDSDYPSNLHSVFNRPLLLFFAGHWDPRVDRSAAAVVGTRSASREGVLRAHRLGRELAEAGITVVSGMAKGIDSAAHLGAIKAHGRTVAVMGTGIRKRYPKSSESIADQILEAGGCLVSQFLPDQPPTKYTFPMRNITMSGLTLATIVVEAGETSGAKQQARAALHHGRTVFLLKSLVSNYDWAKAYVEKGYHGTQAIEVSTTDEIVTGLEAAIPTEEFSVT